VTWIKICATTNLEDALLAAEAGADAVGFVFAPSKRQVTAGTVSSIASRLPAKLEKVGVFANESIHAVHRTVMDTGLTAVQLHGDETLGEARRLRDLLPAHIQILRAVPASLLANATQQIGQWREVITGLVVDSGNGLQRGGTGQTFDWQGAQSAIARARTGLKLIIAGGLTPENVCDAIQAFRPWGVDVASGVEAAPGKKDAEKLRAYIANVRHMDLKDG
jgi:phosphoribosylanthranilate isomerase